MIDAGPAAPAAQAPLRSEAASPERRRVALAVLAANVLFLALDLAASGAPAVVLLGRLAVSAALLHLWWLTGRPARPDEPRWIAFQAALVTAGMATVAAGTGGAQSPYALFLPIVPVVIGIVVPDEPAAPLCSGAVALATALHFLPPTPSVGQLGFVVLANGSSTFYGWVAVLLYRRMRERERAAWAARELALAELRRSESRRALSDRLAALGRLAAGVAHEINNPLAFVGTNLAFVEQELRGRGEPEGELLEALVESREGLDRMKRIVHELRGFARGTADGPGPTDLVEAVGEARRTLAARLGRVARLEVRAEPGLPQAQAQRAELVQVLVNLFANAADALEAGRAGGAGPGLVEVTARTAEEGLVVEVADSGPGLSAEALAHAFEPFFSTKGAHGTGLGLALSREFVERWGGRIEAANRPEGGARLVVTLRRADGLDGPGLGGGGPAGLLAPRPAPR